MLTNKLLADPFLAYLDVISLSIFSRSKYILLLFDATGSPIHAFNKEQHVYSAFAEYLSSHCLFENYALPDVPDLNSLFDYDSTTGLAKIELDADLKSITENLPVERKVCAYNSRNRFETSSDLTRFISVYPLSHIFLYRISRNSFLGVVSMSDFFYRVSVFEEYRAILTDIKDNIVGYNLAFHSIIGGGSAGEWLGKPIAGIVDIEQKDTHLVEEASKKIPYQTLVQWNAKENLSDVFVPLQGSPVTCLSEEGNGTLWENRSEFEYSYLMFKMPVNTDSAPISLELEFSAKEDIMPNIILEGTDCGAPPHVATRSPDAHGYNFSLQRGFEGLQYLLKKSGNPAFAIPAVSSPAGGMTNLTLRKYHDTFLFYQDGDKIGEWKETSPSNRSEERRLYLFLRPQTRVLLRRIMLAQGPAGSRKVEESQSQKVIRVSREGRQYFYNANITSHVWSGNYLNLHILEDITQFRETIRNLEKEKSVLVSILKEAHPLIGRSRGMEELRKNAARVANSDLAVLIEGETGSGKEVLARAIHDLSRRKNKPFMKIDCAMFPEGLMESELFGHEKGAFTGAVSAYAGRLEQAQGGVVFLDEIANLSLSVQAKLLGVLQDFNIQRIGGTRPIPLNIRIVAATNVPLRKLIDRGRFREDLFYRLNQLHFIMPPLRERREDIPLLAEQFIREANTLYDKSVKGLSREALDKIYRADWPGNVRELRSAILRAVLFCEGAEVLADQVPVQQARTRPLEKGKGGPRKKPNRIEMTKEAFVSLVEREKGNLVKISRALDVSRPHVYKKIEQWKIDLNRFRV
jgi:transcriptional regulator with PAS, ATPase and Fis domain